MHKPSSIAAVLALALAGLATGATARAASAGGPAAVCAAACGGVALIRSGQPARVGVGEDDWPGVRRAAADVDSDLAKLAGPAATVSGGPAPPEIIAGTLGHDARIDRLVRAGKLDVGGVRGRWEAYVQQVVDNPEPGVARALVIAGADKRGTIFGLYDLSRRAGVSPWTWWADVPVPVKRDLYVGAGRRVDAPAVKYRGIFLNDEEPSLGGWVRARYGAFDHRFYARVFELILRLKANLLWPAMWDPKAFNLDDPQNAALADEYGVVMGTSHHEPMMRAHAEWKRDGPGGPWDYRTNAKGLRAFWRGGIRRMDGYESLVTVGMRGDGDEPMAGGLDPALLERIVADQRQIIAQVTNKPAADTPQVWALYKEVQDYYDRGMRVPDDVTLLFSDDNWGNLRRLPAPGATRTGGYGIYYHFDYVGDPRDYKWIDTNQIERVWEQMHLAQAYGADRLWIVNVGDLKPMERPISFFLDYAWNPDAWPLSRLPGYSRDWAAEQFGPAHAAEIGDILTRLSQWNARRKPELRDPTTFSLTDAREFERVMAGWDDLLARARAVRQALPPGYDDAYVELVLYPLEASANLDRLYYTVALNRLYAAQGRAATNAMAAEAGRLFRHDAELTDLYNHAVAHGKWDHMMDQSHIGYTGWQEPPANIMPTVERIALPAQARLGVAVEGDRAGYGNGAAPQGPPLTRYGAASRWIEVFDRGAAPLTYTATSSADWLRLSSNGGAVGPATRLEVSADWSRAPVKGEAQVVVAGSDGSRVTVAFRIDGAAPPASFRGFVEGDGVVAVEACHGEATSGGGVRWAPIANLGRTLCAETSFPVTAPPSPPGRGARLAFPVYLADAGARILTVVAAPSLDFRGATGLRFAVSVDSGAPKVVNLDGDGSQAAWAKAVSDDARILTIPLGPLAAGAHTLSLWRVDPGVVFERIVLQGAAPPKTYLGPPESRRQDS